MFPSYAREKFGMAVDALAYTSGDEREKLQRAFRHITAVSEKDFESYPVLADWYRLLLGYARRDNDLTDEQVWAANGLFFRLYEAMKPVED